MSELITFQNLELVIKKNHEIREEVLAQAIRLQTNPSIMKVASAPQLALLILQGFGLIQMPIKDKYWSGAIFVKDEKIIPVINTALPRANQYFTAWHEIIDGRRNSFCNRREAGISPIYWIFAE